MKHVAERLVRYADKNKVIHSDEILDVALKRLATDKTINSKIRTALSAIDPQLELLVPRQVDNPEKQFKRFLQHQFGLVINLTALKREHPAKYRKLQTFGSPTELIKKWGLSYTYEATIEPEDFPRLLNQHSVDGTLRRLYSVDFRLYRAILHQARKEGLNVQQYVERLGFTYEGDRN